MESLLRGIIVITFSRPRVEFLRNPIAVGKIGGAEGDRTPDPQTARTQEG